MQGFLTKLHVDYDGVLCNLSSHAKQHFKFLSFKNDIELIRKYFIG